jgi:hypothetical protein
MKLCTRVCSGTAAFYPKLRFKDAAENISSALLRLCVCGEHKGSVEDFLPQVRWEAVVEAHKTRYGLAPIFAETFLEYVALDSDEGRDYTALLEQRDQGALIQRAPTPGTIPVEEVSQAEYDALWKDLFHRGQG